MSINFLSSFFRKSNLDIVRHVLCICLLGAFLRPTRVKNSFDWTSTESLMMARFWFFLWKLVAVPFRKFLTFHPFLYSLWWLKEILSNLLEIRHCPYWSRRATTTTTPSIPKRIQLSLLEVKQFKIWPNVYKELLTLMYANRFSIEIYYLINLIILIL